MTDPVDTSAEAVERLAAISEARTMGCGRHITRSHYGPITAATLRALLARAEAAEAKLSEASAYRMAASAFIGSKDLYGEFDAYCEARKLPADTVGRLVAVARAVDRQMNDGEVPVSAEVEDAMCALADVAPGVLDQSDG